MLKKEHNRIKFKELLFYLL